MLAVMEDTRSREADAHAAWSERFNDLFAQVAGNFPNARVRRHGRAYLLGLLSASRGDKLSWRLAEVTEDVTPDGLQRKTPPRGTGRPGHLARYVTREFGDPGAVLGAGRDRVPEEGPRVGGRGQANAGTAGSQNCQVYRPLTPDGAPRL